MGEVQRVLKSMMNASIVLIEVLYNCFVRYVTAVVTRSSSKTTKKRHSSRLSTSVTSDASPAAATAAMSLQKSHKSTKSERPSRGRPPLEPRRCSARKKLRLCVGDFLYSQGKTLRVISHIYCIRVFLFKWPNFLAGYPRENIWALLQQVFNTPVYALLLFHYYSVRTRVIFFSIS